MHEKLGTISRLHVILCPQRERELTHVWVDSQVNALRIESAAQPSRRKYP